METIIPIPGFHEPFASLLHLITAVLVVWRGWGLATRARERAERWGVGAFVLGATTMLVLSGSYHLLDVGGVGRPILQRLDHAAIWVMIAASFSAIHGVAFRGVWRWGFLCVVWSIAITGAVVKTVFFATFPELLGLALYLAVGWLGLATSVVLWRKVGPRSVTALLLGGVAYSAGAVYDFGVGPALVPGIVGAHEVFHVAVVVGLLSHWRLVDGLLSRSHYWQRPIAPRDAVRA